MCCWWWSWNWVGWLFWIGILVVRLVLLLWCFWVGDRFGLVLGIGRFSSVWVGYRVFWIICWIGWCCLLCIVLCWILGWIVGLGWVVLGCFGGIWCVGLVFRIIWCLLLGVVSWSGLVLVWIVVIIDLLLGFWLMVWIVCIGFGYGSFGRLVSVLLWSCC